MREDRERLQDILQSISDIDQFVDGMTKAQFLKIDAADRKTFRAICDCLSTLGEAVKNLSPDITDKNSQIDWKGYAGMKDVVVHQYFRVQLDLVWQTIKDELPDLREFVEAELAAGEET